MLLTGIDRRPKGVAALFERTRKRSSELAARLSPEDMVVQSMPDASPAKWHLAHTTWFFETFVLAEFERAFRPHDPKFAHCFNSYYVQAGSRHARPFRGMLTRPSAAEVMGYRAAIDARICALLDDTQGLSHRSEIERRIELGCHHEMQHQELLLMDILHAFSLNPLEPAYLAPAPIVMEPHDGEQDWHSFDGGLVDVGATDGFHFDNEGPRHTEHVPPFQIAGQLVTAGEWIAFIEDGGYDTETLWLSDGWAAVQTEGWRAPLYWRREDDAWWVFGLRGTQLVNRDAPVHHVSYYEAEAFARWAGARLPSEVEWEIAARTGDDDGHFIEGGYLRPRPPSARRGLRQMMGEVWQWTRSAYAAYPGFQPAVGALGEYNGKFMVNQYVLRGASFATPRDHARITYRNFFHPHLRWQFAGLRLAKDN
ncbi:MAG: ergothioneine biosynthesis protein EgtB [Pseudomonadota bacterium]